LNYELKIHETGIGKIPVSNLVEQIRIVKSDDEVENLRKAYKI